MNFRNYREQGKKILYISTQYLSKLGILRNSESSKRKSLHRKKSIKGKETSLKLH